MTKPPEFSLTEDLGEEYLLESLQSASGAIAASGRRDMLTKCRDSILKSAFAAEAFVNRFIAEAVDRQIGETLDRLPTTSKYLIAPRLAVGVTLFDLGRNPIQNMASLFRTRDRFVHPRPRTRSAESWVEMQAQPLTEFGPVKATRYIAAVVAAQTGLLEVLRSIDRPNEPSEQLISGLADLVGNLGKLAPVAASQQIEVLRAEEARDLTLAIARRLRELGTDETEEG